MIDPGVVAGAVVALGGVGLGSWLSGRSQNELLRRTHQREIQRSREDAYVALLIAFRKYRVYLTTEATTVRLGGLSPGGRVPLIEGGKEYSDDVQDATARLHILEGGNSPVIVAAHEIQRRFNDVARARADHPVGAVPEPVMDELRAAERSFARAAHQELRQFETNGKRGAAE